MEYSAGKISQPGHRRIASRAASSFNSNFQNLGRALVAGLLIFLSAGLVAVKAEANSAPANRLDWFREARFGLFIHWGALLPDWPGRMGPGAAADTVGGIPEVCPELQPRQLQPAGVGQAGPGSRR